MAAWNRYGEAAAANRKRPYKIWVLDVSKQAASMGCAHIAGIVNAHLLHSASDPRTDKCSWYFISFSLDTTLCAPPPLPS